MLSHNSWLIFIYAYNIGIYTYYWGMKIHRVRHWQTYHNQEQKLQWWYDWKLTQTWKDQAAMLWKRIADESFDAVLSSDLSRASDTAQILIDNNSTPHTLITNELLRERTFWEYDDSYKLEIKNKLGIEDYQILWDIAHKMEGAETDEEFYNRAQKVLELLKSEYANKSICVTSHWWLSRYINLIMNWVLFEDRASHKFKFNNTSLSVFKWDWSRWTIEMLNDTSHLDESWVQMT